MNKLFRFSFAIVSIFLLFLAISSPGQALVPIDPLMDQAIEQAGLPWKTMYVQREPDPIRDVGRYVSMALRPFDDYPVIAYYDYTNADLMVAVPVLAHNGNCGTDEAWLCESIDGATDEVGMFSSIDVWGNSIDSWKLGISYYDITNRSLKAAILTCSGIFCDYEYATVQAPVVINSVVGYYSSFKFDSAGNASIAYFRINTIALWSDLQYAYQVPSDGNCGEGSATGLWECKWISFLPGVGRYASLDIGFDDTPYIAFYTSDDHLLRIAYHKSGVNSCDEPDWTCLILDGGTADVGSYPSITAPRFDGDHYHIAYYDKTNGQLKYFYESGEPSIVDANMGISPDPMGISMQLDNNGEPVIAYQKVEEEFSRADLWLARPNFVYDDGEPGNCGDLAYWRCIPLETGNQYVGEAHYASLVVNSKGRLAIAYSELANDDQYMSLKITYQTQYHTLLPIITR